MLQLSAELIIVFAPIGEDESGCNSIKEKGIQK